MGNLRRFYRGARRLVVVTHHRKPRSNGGTDEERNLSIVLRRKHVAWHMLFGNGSPQEIAAEINKVWLDPDFKFVVVEQQKEPSNQLELMGFENRLSK